jgi:hypothetical protein
MPESGSVVVLGEVPLGRSRLEPPAGVSKMAMCVCVCVCVCVVCTWGGREAFSCIHNETWVPVGLAGRKLSSDHTIAPESQREP